MAQSITLINKSTDTFDNWVDRFNETANVITLYAMTANSDANGAFVTGNSFLFGIFGANTITVYTGLRGGNVQASAVLPITSNVSITETENLSVGNATVNSVVTSSSLTVSNGGITGAYSYTGWIVGNTSANQTHVAVGNSTVNVVANNSTLLLGGNVTANQTHIFIGNSTVNVIANSSALLLGGLAGANQTHVFVGASVLLNSTSVGVGANVYANLTHYFVGNATVNVVANSSTISLGGNVVANQTHIMVGNASVNVVINSSSVYVSGASFVLANAVAVGAENNTYKGSRSRFNFIGGNNVFLEVTDDAGGNQINVQINSVATSGAAIIGGTNTNIQFNDNDNFRGTNGFTYDVTTNNVFVGNTVTIGGSLVHTQSIAERGVAASFVTSTGPDEVDSFAIATYRTAEYVYSIKNDAANAYQSGKLVVLNDGTAGHMEEFGVTYSNTDLGIFSTGANATHILVRFTPTASLSYTVKAHRTLIPV